MKLLGETVLMGIWGLLSLIVLPEIAKTNIVGQIIFGLLWIGVLLATLFLYDLKSKKMEDEK
jgi:hypothetical protein